MRPYLVLIQDSFREALASRVLWVVLVLIALLLVALAPLSYRPVLTTAFRPDDIAHPDRAIRLLASHEGPAARPAAQALSAALDEPFRERLRRTAEGEDASVRRDELADRLNRLIEREPEWYDAEVWSREVRLREQRALEERGEAQLTAEERRRRARLRIESALAGALRPRPTQSVQLTYAGMVFPADVPTSPNQFRDFLNDTVLPVIVNFFLGTLAVLVAILVTAPVIPHLFQGGSLQLLLSKPISRPLLLLAKFLGGCAFILVCVTPLVFGLWLLAGLQFDLWNHRLLLCIPLFLFLFAVYYSVSAFAGLVWRNAIVAVVMTVLFWGASFSVRLTHGMFEGLVAKPEEIARMVETDGTLLAVTQGGGLNRWNARTNRWLPMIEREGLGPQRRIVGPVAVDDEKVVAAQTLVGGFGRFGGGTLALEVFDLQRAGLSEPGVSLPVGTRVLAADGDNLLALGADGLFRIDAEAASRGAAREADATQRGWDALLRLLGGDRAPQFEPVGPPTLPLSPPQALAVGADRSLFVYGRGILVRLEADESGYRETAMTQFDEAPESPVGLAPGGDSLFLATKTGTVRVLDARSLEIIAEHSLPKRTAVRAIVSEPGGERAALLTADGRIRLLRPDGTGEALDAAASGDASAIAWTAPDRLLVAHDLDRVDVVDPQSGTTTRSLRPQRTVWRNLHAYVLDPIHLVFPRPGELGETVQAVVLGREEVEARPGDDDLQSLVVELNPWGAVLNNAVFLAVMLTLSCVYISRQDF